MLGLMEATARHHVLKLRDDSTLTQVGAGRSSRYRLREGYKTEEQIQADLLERSRPTEKVVIVSGLHLASIREKMEAGLQLTPSDIIAFDALVQKVEL